MVTPSRPILTIDLDALVHNYKTLATLAAPAECAAVVKADAYGLGLGPAARALHAAGARTFFVAQTPEGVALREVLGPGPDILILNGFFAADAAETTAFDLIPCLCSPEQIAAFRAAFDASRPAALHLETGINRLALTAADLASPPCDLNVTLLMSHLACADDPAAEMNTQQLNMFRRATETLSQLHPAARRSLSATGGILLGPAFRFDLVRAGIGLYGGLPFAAARPVVALHAPLLQVRRIAMGESVGYSATWTATRPSRIGVLPLGYADGFHRATTGARVWVEGRPAPVIGRVSMDLITVDLTDLPEPAPGAMAEIIGPHQTVDALAAHAGTLGYEVLTGLGRRYLRRHSGGPAG